MSYIIYTDGSCRGNGTENSSGGFGVVITKDNELVATYRKDCETDTTNNREELKAILYAFLNYGVKEKTIGIIIFQSFIATLIIVFKHLMIGCLNGQK